MDKSMFCKTCGTERKTVVLMHKAKVSPDDDASRPACGPNCWFTYTYHCVECGSYLSSGSKEDYVGFLNSLKIFRINKPKNAMG